MSKTTETALPPIPDKRYFAIGEASDLCGVKAHVLRYWEQEFPQLSPPKRRGNRRYYRVADIQTARRIRSLLYDDGFTVAGARAQLANRDSNTSSDPASSAGLQRPPPSARLAEIRHALEQIREKLDP